MRNPYVTGAYVTGPNHYGREEIVETLLRGGCRAHWLVASRRTGRTSLLRHLEGLAAGRGRLLPLYWHLQGSTTVRALGRSLAGAVADELSRFEALGLPAAMADEEDALTLLTHLRRLALRRGRELLLLCDEADELVDLAGGEPEFAQRFHRELTAGAGLRAVVTSTSRAYRLYDAAAGWSGPPFLNGFDMSQRLGRLSPKAAKALILQAQAPRGSRVKAPAAMVAALRDSTNDHPYLLQWLCARVFDESGTLRFPEEDDLRPDPAVAGMFEYDWNQLPLLAKRVLLALHSEQAMRAAELREILRVEEALLAPQLAGLEAQGLVRRTGVRFTTGSALLARWLAREAGRLNSLLDAPLREVQERPAAPGPRDQDVAALTEQLNARRGRLVELEQMRASAFLHTPPQVYAEIAQLESEIAALRTLLVRRVAL